MGALPSEKETKLARTDQGGLFKVGRILRVTGWSKG